MSPNDFTKTMIELGLSQVDAARLLSVDPRTVRRWVADPTEISGPAEQALRAWRRLNQLGLPWSPDSIDLVETDPEQISLHRADAVGLDNLLAKVEKRGGSSGAWKTLKQATTKPPAKTLLQQQDRFEDFIYEYNYERPLQALEMKKPTQLYTPSTRKYEGLPDVSYPFHDKTVTVTNCGRICLGGKKIHFSTVFAGHDVGLRQVEEDVWLVSFMDYDMAYFDMESSRVQALENPFGPKVLGM